MCGRALAVGRLQSTPRIWRRRRDPSPHARRVSLASPARRVRCSDSQHGPGTALAPHRRRAGAAPVLYGTGAVRSLCCNCTAIALRRYRPEPELHRHPATEALLERRSKARQSAARAVTKCQDTAAPAPCVNAPRTLHTTTEASSTPRRPRHAPEEGTLAACRQPLGTSPANYTRQTRKTKALVQSRPHGRWPRTIILEQFPQAHGCGREHIRNPVGIFGGNVEDGRPVDKPTPWGCDDPATGPLSQSTRRVFEADSRCIQAPWFTEEYSSPRSNANLRSCQSPARIHACRIRARRCWTRVAAAWKGDRGKR